MFYIGIILNAKINQKKQNKKSAVHQIKNVIKLAIIPHADNDYRPHLVRRYGLIAILFFTIIMQYGAAYAQTSTIQNNGTDISSLNLLKKTNLVRSSKDLVELTESEKLTRAAQLKLDDMFENQYWDHNSPRDITPWK